MINFSRLAMLGLAASLSGNLPAQEVAFAPSVDTTQRIEKLWLVTFTDNSGQEIVAQATALNGQYVPLIAADEGRLESIIEAGRGLAKATSIKFHLIELTGRSDLGDIAP